MSGSTPGDAGSGDTAWMYVAGGLGVVFLFLGYHLVGTVQEAEARQLLEAAIPTIRFFASGVIAAAATILALMLTLLGFSESVDADLSSRHYERVQRIATLNVVAMVASVFLMMLLAMPVTESDQLEGFYTVAYYVIAGTSAAVGGLMISIALMLRRAVIGLIGLFHPSRTSDLVPSDDSDDSPSSGEVS